LSLIVAISSSFWPARLGFLRYSHEELRFSDVHFIRIDFVQCRRIGKNVVTISFIHVEKRNAAWLVFRFRERHQRNVGGVIGTSNWQLAVVI
jgi:hypothetical protein